MKYMILVAEPASEFAMRTETDPQAFEAFIAPWKAYADAMAGAGVMVDGQALQAPGTATTIRVVDGKREVQDGPYADAKEQLGGYFIIDVPDVETAKEWAAKAPTTKTGFTELRPILPFDAEM